MLTRLSAVTDLVRGRHLLLTLLKLFSYCVKIGVNRKALLQPHLNAISIMLASLNMVRNSAGHFVVPFLISDPRYSSMAKPHYGISVCSLASVAVSLKSF